MAGREPALRAARAARPAGRQGGVRAGRVRLVLGAGRRRARVLVPGAGGRGRRPGRSSPSRASAADGGAHRRAAGVRRRRRGAVRLLHARAGRRRARPARPQPRARPTSRSARSCRATSAAAPATAASSPPCSGRRCAEGERMTDVVTRGRARAGGGIGDSPPRPDGVAKVQGRSRSRPTCGPTACCWGATLRSPHPYARIVRIDPSPAWRIAGRRGGHHRRRRARPAHLRPDRARTNPCSPATSCATSASRSPPSPPTTPRPAGGRWPPSSSSTRCSTPLIDPEDGDRRRAPADPPGRQRAAPPAHRPRRRRRHRRRRRRGHLRDRHAGPGLPRPRGGAGHPRPRRRRRRAATSPRSGCTRTASRSPPASAWPRSKVRLVLGGVGGAFGAREDISLQVHTCLLALRTGRPGEDAVRPGGELPRPRAPPPGHDLDAPPRHAPTAAS